MRIAKSKSLFFSDDPVKNRACFKGPVLFLFFFFAGLFLPSQNCLHAETTAGNSCVACHQDVWEDLKGSIHGEQGILCDRCHGGDPSQSAKELAKTPGTGYLGVPDKKQIVQRCGECHADVETMNFYGTRTDQLTRYKTSHHGKKLFSDGDEKVAACSDCHGYHDVVKVSEPNSPVYPTNIPKTCGRCHSNEKLMSKRGLPSDITAIYKDSVHGRALLEKKDISAAQCASCHGSHGAMPPGVKDISSTCGKCHMNEKKYFLESVHAKISEKGKFSECVSCHGNHGVQPPTPVLLEQACVKCHEDGSRAARYGSRLFQILRKAGSELEQAQALVRQASIEGLFVEEETASLEEAKTNVISMAPVQHTLSLEKLKELEQKTTALANGIRSNVRQKRQNLKLRRMMLIPVWVFVFIMAAALWARGKQLKKKKNSGGHKHE